jgi:hypothetical protein
MRSRDGNPPSISVTAVLHVRCAASDYALKFREGSAEERIDWSVKEAKAGNNDSETDRLHDMEELERRKSIAVALNSGLIYPRCG